MSWECHTHFQCKNSKTGDGSLSYASNETIPKNSRPELLKVIETLEIYYKHQFYENYAEKPYVLRTGYWGLVPAY